MNAAVISPEEILEMIQNMKLSFQSDLFGVPKDESFSGSINQISGTDIVGKVKFKLHG